MLQSAFASDLGETPKGSEKAPELQHKPPRELLESPGCSVENAPEPQDSRAGLLLGLSHIQFGHR
eukprot:6606053-Alexandrium_andersonii.AAC.1